MMLESKERERSNLISDMYPVDKEDRTQEIE